MAYQLTSLGISVLALLRARPMHGYEMFQTLVERHADRIVKVRPGSLYHVVDRLTEEKLIRRAGTARDGKRPERAIYEITDAGRETCRRWLEEMLASVRNEFPDFPAALSSLMLLGPADSLTVLKSRAEGVAEVVERLKGEIAGPGAGLPRVTMLETEYQLAVSTAELDWLNGVIADLTDGSLSWSEDLLEQAKAFLTE